jgi:hypothetical protein
MAGFGARAVKSINKSEFFAALCSQKEGVSTFQASRSFALPLPRTDTINQGVSSRSVSIW